MGKVSKTWLMEFFEEVFGGACYHSGIIAEKIVPIGEARKGLGGKIGDFAEACVRGCIAVSVSPAIAMYSFLKNVGASYDRYDEYLTQRGNGNQKNGDRE